MKEKLDFLTELETEALRFLKRLEEYKEYSSKGYYGYQSKIRSACRRSSMDLTRMLAELRRHQL